MDIRPIKTAGDYETALAAIGELMNAEPDTPEGDRLDVLATLVDAYEARHFSIEAPGAGFRRCSAANAASRST